MHWHEIAHGFFSLTLIPIGFAVASLSARGQSAAALGLYLAAAVLPRLNAKSFSVPLRSPAPIVEQAALRIFTLLILTALQARGSCPTWFLALLISITLMQWSGFAMLTALRPLRSNRPLPAVVPEIAQWNRVAEVGALGIFLCDFVLIDFFPTSFRFSPGFHLTGYALMSSLAVLQLAADFYRVRRPLGLMLSLTPWKPWFAGTSPGKNSRRFRPT